MQNAIDKETETVIGTDSTWACAASVFQRNEEEREGGGRDREKVTDDGGKVGAYLGI
jgi:hypothetical protein